MKGYAFDKNQKDSVQLFAMFEAAAQCPIPIVAKVKGHVMGGANGLVAMADIAAACSDTVFAFSEVRLGLVPAVISPFVLAKMNKASAREKMITGRRFSEPERLNSGLVQFVGAEKAVDRFINEITEAILNSGPEAVHTTIQLLGDLDRCSDWEQIKELTTRVIAERRVSVEGQEGLTAFFDKRKPTWSKSLNANH